MDPETKETVKFLVYNMNEDDFEYLEMDADDYQAMCEEEDKADKERKERMEALYERDREDAYYAMLHEDHNQKRAEEEYAERMTQRLDDYED